MRFPETLVMGATGRIGRLLQHQWRPTALGSHVLWQGRSTAGLGPAARRVIVQPLTQPGRLAQVATDRQILCLAGGVPRRGTLADNGSLAQAALRAATPGQRVILCSSAAVYGAQTGVLKEGTALRPGTDYGLAKLEMEQRSTALAADLGVSLCLLRIGNIAGVDACLGGWEPGFQLDQFGDGSTPVRSYIGVATLARVLADLLALPHLPPVLNIAQPGQIAMDALLAAAGLDWRPRPAPDSAIAKVRLDTTLLQNMVRVLGVDAVQMVQEWRWLEPHMATEQNQG